jgi:hypothetical protein
MGLVMEWATIHQDELMADWLLARQQAELNLFSSVEHPAKAANHDLMRD